MFIAALLIKVLNQKLLVSTNSRMEKIKYGTGRQEKNTQKYR